MTTDPNNGTTATAGGLADPTTRVVIGGNTNYGAFSGALFQAGYAFSNGLAIEGGGFFSGTQARNFGAASDANGSPFLFRPFVNVDTGNANAGQRRLVSGSDQRRCQCRQPKPGLGRGYAPGWQFRPE